MIVFCTTCKGRTQHLERTLPANLLDNPDATFVVIDYNSQDHLAEYLLTHHTEDFRAGRLVVYSYRGDHPFRMAHAKNMAHRCGMLEGGSVLVNVDADNFTGPGFAAYLETQFSQFPGSFMWARMIKDGEGRLPKGISGRIAVSTTAFLNAGGYDERFDTWSPDDKDFAARLRRLGYEAREIEPRFLNAIMHTDKMRFREYKHVWTSAGCYDVEEVLDCDTSTIVNGGNFGCGTVYRNFDFTQPIELNPLPTRVFGIGMHKTATTSLHTALELLGFDGAHWKTARWAKAVWREMTTVGRSVTLEKHYTMSDLPFPLLYRELDRAYPGSKFILTTRDESKWIESVRRHWSHEYNPYRHTWNDDAFTHKAHKLLYGQKGFDRELFLARFRRHNAEVLEYFRDRPGDLLVMDMESAGWSELCGFLGVHPPEVPYPREFRTRSKADMITGEVPLMPKTNWQKQQQRKAGTTPAPVAAGQQQPWYVTLIETLEAIWNALPASQSEANHPVAQKLAQLKQSIPK